MTQKYFLIPITSIIFTGALLLISWAFLAKVSSNKGFADGQWSARNQLVFDDATGKMQRRLLKVWDAHPQKNLDFYFEPGQGEILVKDGVISGKGILTWRIRGAASYDRRAVFSRYDGEFINGRPHGKGHMARRDGSSYDGEYQNGLRHGQGSLRSKIGDRYVGQFKNGKPHGLGRYAQASGEIYVGQFRAGKRHGAGVLTRADGQQVTSLWSQGVDQKTADPVMLAQWADSTDPFAGRASARTDLNKISISVVTDQKRYQRLKDNYLMALDYTHQIGSRAVSILPSDQKMLSIWKGDSWMYDDNDVLMGYNNWENDLYRLPIYLQLALSNKASKPALVKRIELRFLKSSTDQQPFLGIGSKNGLTECSGEADVKYNPVIDFNNIGWGAAQNASISYAFTANKKPGSIKRFKFRTPVGKVDKKKSVSLEKALRLSGVDISKLKKFRFKCPSYDQLEQCGVEALKKMPTGRLKRHTYIASGKRIVTKVEGVMNFRWKDSAGKTRKGRKKFAVRILLGNIEVGNPAECGAGGPEDPKAGIPTFKLKLDQNNYSMRYPLKRTLRLKKRQVILPFALKSNKSSNHLFQVIVHFKDGSKKISKPIKVLYARHRHRYSQ